ncbi:hypothetical protein G7B40_024130 [Aetokthonos hydrillicola Thurmond2011]|jgi:hypothetical protein|uniref:Uncharacterized protein n=1 Tax=Aetokthonos hydrillicola Thurmond2011 TaxID=2712845 RepID=A0AAP5MB75_9CYAN|nr:hypothetical protein [Aetokthonos hydrillicola]MBO3461124.1 hypothetical protein [Aetokthonos hydrillicola CCALA 1050]MBW4586893.1 hypothetical protein [Aetokthonos hydrillicola CCALA 1050]MDR9897632.1 hypothetical protein [Aetokthonos hydrillicola Thurmond2011]
MSITQAQKFLTAPIAAKNRPSSRFSVAFWFSLSLIFAASYISEGLQEAFSHEYVVGDNAREYVSWMYRYFNPKLFPNDLIADYFQSVTPIGFGAFYKMMARLGVDPVLLGKLLPMVLGLLTTSYGFAVCMQILPVPLAGFLATILLNQSISLHDDLFSATPRDFIYPLFLAFLYYLLRGSLLGVLVAIALQALIYPLIAFIDVGILLFRLCKWQGGQLHLSKDKKDYIFFATSAFVALVAIIPYAIQSSKFGPTITAAVAKTIPEYLSGGRVSYFNLNPVSFWLDGRDSGFLALMSPPQLFIGLLLPIILFYQARFPLAKQVTSCINIIPRIILASTCMFFVAHAVAFRLHWPSRYTHHTFKIVFALAAGITLTLMLHAAFHWSEQLITKPRRRRRQFLALGTAAIVGLLLLLYPSSLKVFPKTPYVTGAAPMLYDFLRLQTQDSLVASLAGEANNIPVFAKRPILVGSEFGLPFHTKYYAQFRQRAIDLINAQYTNDIKQVISFIDKYNVKLWLLERTAFKPEYIAENKWIKQYQPAADSAIANLQKGNTPALSRLMQSCNVLETHNLVVLEAECITKSK